MGELQMFSAQQSQTVRELPAGKGPDASASPVLWPRGEPRGATAWHSSRMSPWAQVGGWSQQPERNQPSRGAHR